MSANRSQLREDTFDSAENETLLLSLEESMAMPELLLEAGQKVELNFTFGDGMEMDKFYFVALRAVDDGGSMRRVSGRPVYVERYGRVPNLASIMSAYGSTKIVLPVLSSWSSESSSVTSLSSMLLISISSSS